MRADLESKDTTVTNAHPNRTRISAATIAVALLTGVAACGTTDSPTDAATTSSASIIGTNDDSVIASSADLDDGALWLFDSSVVHDISIEFDQDAYDAMIAIYETEGEKEWIDVTVTIDGTTMENVGLRLKGNSSLFGLTSATAGDPEELPWLLRFDKFVDDQLYQGHGDLVIRSNSTETALNEAVAVELLGLAGLATEEAIATQLTVNGGDTELRLAMELPDDDYWVEANFSEDSLLYKADSAGDYSYRGDDPDAYDDVFDQKYGDDDLEPLMDFLDFVNNADDATFAAQLGDHLDVEAFATYLAYQDLIGNGDDIDGRGNNSYLHYDGGSELFTIVNWDLNLAFNTANVNGGGGAAAGGAGGRPQPPGGGQRDAVGPENGTVGSGGSNVLASRFLANTDFAAMYDSASTELTEALFDSGVAETIVDTWVDMLSTEANGLVEIGTVETEAAAIRSWIHQA